MITGSKLIVNEVSQCCEAPFIHSLSGVRRVERAYHSSRTLTTEEAGKGAYGEERGEKWATGVG